MNAYFAASNLSNQEKEDILKQHRTLYDGYRTLQPQVNNTQPLYVQDFAKDKGGVVLNNKGEVKPYTNFGINEQVEEVCDECGVRDMFEGKGMCSECGGEMMEGECMECGWKGEVGALEENEKMMCECGGEMMEGECMECGYKMEETTEGYRTGKLSDIYNVEDLGDSDFDYVEGGGNDYGTFEKMHHMKGIKNEQIEDNYEDPDNEDDGFEDLEVGSSEMYEQGYTGGGNAPDMDISNIKPAYDFISNGPDSVYPTESEVEESAELYTDKFNDDNEFETMESAWADEELDEANDVSGVQGMYGDMKPAYDFDSEGPGSAGPYQTSSWGGGAEDEGYEEGELEIDFDEFDPRDKSWEEIKAHTGDWEEIDEDLKENFISKKNKINEMMIRMKMIK